MGGGYSPIGRHSIEGKLLELHIRAIHKCVYEMNNNIQEDFDQTDNAFYDGEMMAEMKLGIQLLAQQICDYKQKYIRLDKILQKENE